MKLKALMESSSVFISEEAYKRMMIFHEMLLDCNKKMDLTNVPEEEMAQRHYADSLIVLSIEGLIFPGAKVIDVGTGAGFPGIPLAIARPDLEVCLMDSQQKRCLFLRNVCEKIDLKNASVVHSRAEDAARSAHREKYEIAMARALAPLNVLAEYMLPFLIPGGKALCWKGPSVVSELSIARTTYGKLGGKLGKLFSLPLSERQSYIQIIEKVSATDPRYPRRAGLPSKHPLD